MTTKIIQKMTLSAMFIAIGLILERVLMIPIGEVNRIAFGSSAIILASLIVGPLFGAIVGGSMDILGFMINSVGTYTPYVTLGLMALGILPWLLVQVLKPLFRLPAFINLSYVFLAGLSAYGIWFIYSRDQYVFNLGGGNFIDVPLNTILARVILPLFGVLIYFGFVFVMNRISSRFSNKPLINQTQLMAKDIVFIVLVSEILISIIWGVQWRVWYLGIPPLALYFNQIAFFVIGFPVKTFIVLTGLRTYQRYQNIVK
jgi:ECF transporter S component (folate family)